MCIIYKKKNEDGAYEKENGLCAIMFLQKPGALVVF
jgi:hypothetical protein